MTVATIAQPQTLANVYKRRLRWIERCCKIINKAGELVPLVPNAAQIKLARAMYEQEKRLGLVRIDVLKGRQFGISTFIAAWFHAICVESDHTRTLICAHDDEASTVLYEKHILIHQNNPLPLSVEKSNAKRHQWAEPHGSVIRVQTAGGERLGRSDTFRCAHLSEVAFWTNQTETMNSVMQCVPDLPGTIVIRETTGNGVGDLFETSYRAAVEAKAREGDAYQGFEPLFLSWRDHEEYRRPVPEGYEWGELSDDEQEMRADGWSDEQLYWRRWTLRTKCGNNLSKFRQEYPRTWQEAFQVSGRPAIPVGIVEEHRRQVCEGRRARLVRNRLDGQKVEIVYGPGPWVIFEEPVPEDDYCLAGDVAEGELADPANPNSEPDRSTIFVMNRRTQKQVAGLCEHMPPDEHGREMRKAAMLYHSPDTPETWGTPEVNSCGVASLIAFRDGEPMQGDKPYQHIMPRDVVADALPGKEPEAARVGWKTTPGNRNLLIDEWIAANMLDPGGWNGVYVRDERLVDEEAAFVYKKSGKREHRDGMHDDYLFGAMICWQVHCRCPRTLPRRLETSQAKRPGRYAGGFDDLDEDE